MVGGVRFEHTHRLIAATVGILTVILSVLLFRMDSRPWLRNLGLLAVLAVTFQAILGGITVLYLLPTPVSVMHACLAQTFFCLIAAIAFFVSPEWKNPVSVTDGERGSIRRLLVLTTSLAYVQLVIGAITRHSGGKGVSFHIIVGFLILLHTLFVVFKISSRDSAGGLVRFSSHAVLLGVLVLIQVFLGFGAFITTLMMPKAEAPRTAEILLTAAHQSMGALILAGYFLLTLRVYRVTKDPS